MGLVFFSAFVIFYQEWFVLGASVASQSWCSAPASFFFFYLLSDEVEVGFSNILLYDTSTFDTMVKYVINWAISKIVFEKNALKLHYKYKYKYKYDDQPDWAHRQG